MSIKIINQYNKNNPIRMGFFIDNLANKHYFGFDIVYSIP